MHVESYCFKRVWVLNKDTFITKPLPPEFCLEGGGVQQDPRCCFVTEAERKEYTLVQGV